MLRSDFQRHFQLLLSIHGGPGDRELNYPEWLALKRMGRCAAYATPTIRTTSNFAALSVMTDSRTCSPFAVTITSYWTASSARPKWKRNGRGAHEAKTPSSGGVDCARARVRGDIPMSGARGRADKAGQGRR
jgi:hypothetical protein